MSSAPEIHHVTLQTGQVGSFSRATVSAEVLALASPWLNRTIAAGNPIPLPIDSLQHYSGQALVAGQSEALLVTIFAPGGPHTKEKPHKGTPMPLVTLGVVQRPQYGQQLWEMMCAHATDLHPRVRKPPEPWLAANIYPSLNLHLECAAWLADFEQCVAWAWITQCPALEDVGAQKDTP